MSSWVRRYVPFSPPPFAVDAAGSFTMRLGRKVELLRVAGTFGRRPEAGPQAARGRL
ncbi:MAG TPA: hypothetical protein VGY54_27745 [Polyangiaceae bacterium]|nr:hypothetical protein [Polyangiaceae bacterium]